VRFRRQVPWARSKPRHEPEPAAPEPAAAEFGRPPRRGSFRATVSAHRLLRDVLIIGATFGVGYLIASVWLSPVPLLTSDHAVPRVLDLPAGEAQRKLAELGFRAKLDDERPHPTVPRGAIVWQDPPPGMILPENTVVSLVPSAGLQQVPVPDIIGLAMPYAGRVLAAAGLKVGEVDTVAADPEPNVVVATRPPAGGGREPGGAVDVVVSGQTRVRTSQSARIIHPLMTGARP
jgi:beta-lactam-binding protein with PASTA domain